MGTKRQEQKELIIRKAILGETEDIAACHRAALPEDVFPAFGDAFLARYFRSAIESDSAELLVVERSGKPVGFALVLLKNISMVRHLRLPDLLRFGIGLIARPKLLASATNQLLHSQPQLGEETAEIAFIAVRPEAQGLGIGRRLVSEVNHLAADRGVKYLRTKTANPDLADYYRRTLDGEAIGRFVAGGREYQYLLWRVR